MPTPVSAARQCLTQEAASALDDAVAVARRRSHAQTTSLHMVSALLSLPRSSLREACARTRNNAYSARVQFKALELSLGVSLDRLPSSSQGGKAEEPPVSNSLMAAIKRSQANQRRQPDNYSFYQQQQQQYASCSSSIPVVKVELQNLIISILDDPLVSRVFGEAGFRSCDIKLATLRPGNSTTYHAHHLFDYCSRYKRTVPPLFLCNLSGTESNTDAGRRGFTFPFMRNFSEEENSRRIGEIMVRDKKRSPLLVGVSAVEALKAFLETVQKNVKGILPEGLIGLKVVCIRDEIARYLSGDCDEMNFEEIEGVSEGGVVANFGDLNAFLGEDVGVDRLGFLVRRLGKLVQVHKGKLWLIGAAASHELLSEILGKFPTIEEDWDLDILPITSLKFSAGGSYPRSSLMGSFVPLGGFFSMPSESQSPLSNAWQYVARCHLCNEKCEQEIAMLSNGGHYASIAERCKSSLPSWLQSTELNTQNGLASVKGKDDMVLLNTKIMAIRKKWDGICQQHHFNQAFAKGLSHQIGYQYPRILGFQVGDRKEDSSCERSNHSNESSKELGNKNMSSILSTEVRKSSSLRGLSSPDSLSKVNNQSISSKSSEIPSEATGEPVASKSHQFNSLSADLNDCRSSPTPVTSVTIDLGLGIASALTCREPVDQSHTLTNEDLFARGISSCQLQTASCFLDDSHMNFGVKDPKSLYKALVERVGQQEEAISTIVKTITCQNRTAAPNGVNRRSIWINCQGPNQLGKKKLGIALADILYGGVESLIYVDLSFSDEMPQTDLIFNSRVMNKYDITMRGTVVDYLVEKLSKKPSVVLIENINKADIVVQNSLSRAVKTDRFTDLRGREVTISNCVFLVTTKFPEGGERIYSEEDILRAQGSSIKILIRFNLNDDPSSENLPHSDLCLMNKRKLVSQSRAMDQHGSMEATKRPHKASNSCPDLNLPAEGSEVCNVFSSESDSDSTSDNSRSWQEDFNRQIDQIVVFKPFDFDSLAEKLLKDMTEQLHNVVGSECSMEIEPKVMQQLLAAAYLLGNKSMDIWIQRVLRQGFARAMQKFSINASSIVKLDAAEGPSSEGLLPSSVVVK